MESIAARHFFLVLLLSAAFLLLPPSASAIDVQYCKKGANYPVKVSGVDISPYPVVRGKTTTFNISANTGDKLSSGKLVIGVKYIWFDVYEEAHELCKETSCPVQVGEFILSHQETLPSYTPPGSYTLTMKLQGEDGEQLTCITFGFSIGFVADADS